MSTRQIKLPKTKLVPLTPEEREARRAQRALQKKEKLEQELRAAEAAQAEFEAKREAIWAELWTQAMQLVLYSQSVDWNRLSEDGMSYRERWLHALSVEPTPGKEHFKTEAYGKLELKKDTLTLANVDEIRRDLASGFEYIKDIKDAQEAARLEAIRIENVRREALSLLSDEQKKVLGLAEGYSRY